MRKKQLEFAIWVRKPHKATVKNTDMFALKLVGNVSQLTLAKTQCRLV